MSIAYTATYSPEDNKLRLYASSRLDEDTYARVRAAGFIWAPKQELFVSPAWTPLREDLLLELAGEIGDEDKTLVERAEERAERFDTYSEHREHDAVQASESVKQLADGIPLGQPILIGHHSQRHAERNAKKIENGIRRAAKMWETSAYWLDRAEGAIRHAKYRELPSVRCRRIKTIEADKRRQERAIAEAEKFVVLWNETEGITRARASAIASCDHISYRPEGKDGWVDLWTALENESLSPEEAREKALRVHGRTIASARRWVAHFENRLAYERAMLAAAGFKEPEKKKSVRAALPLLNYMAETITYPNPYGRAEPVVLPVVAMTKAEYAKIHADYKGTRVIDGTHRYRTTVRMGAGRGLVAVFLSDSKVHEIPSKASS